MSDIMKLQNGSDIRGVALTLPGKAEANITEENAKRIGAAFIDFLRDRTGKLHPRVSIGRDTRVTGEALLGFIGDGMRFAGAETTDFGIATTPAMFMSTVTGEAPFDGACMVTASHLPYERNGFKFFTKDGGLEKADITDILTRASTWRTLDLGSTGKCEKADFMAEYARMLREKIIEGADAGDKPLSGLHIVVDAGNGAGGFFARDVLSPLGCDTTGSVFLEPDGMFPNHAPNPEDERAMRSIISATLDAKADLGIIFDTDVDRAGAVLSDGRELNRNLLIAMIAAIELRDHPGTTIVTDSITSTGLAEFILARGGRHRRFKRGYRNVINEAVRLNREGISSELAMETSGHGALKENYFLDDGAYLMVKLIIELARAKKTGATLEALIDGLREPKESREIRMPLTEADFIACGKRILEATEAWASAQEGYSIAPDNFEGVRVNCDPAHGDGWFLLRLSLHDPLLPLNIESDSVGGVEAIREKLYSFLKDAEGLDTRPLGEAK